MMNLEHGISTRSKKFWRDNMASTSSPQLLRVFDEVQIGQDLGTRLATLRRRCRAGTGCMGIGSNLGKPLKRAPKNWDFISRPSISANNDGTVECAGSHLG